MTTPQSKETAGSERELKDCPMCGCKATFVKHSAGIPGTQGFDKWDAVACKHCRTTVGACDRRFRNRDDAAAAWNRRASQPSGAAGGEVDVAGVVAEASAKTAHYDALAALARNRRMVLEEIAGSKPLTATPQQFADHLQRLARKAVEDYMFAGNDDDRASLASPSSGGWMPSRIADSVVQMVVEMDDRTSPEDWPEAMLVTGPELHAFILMAFEQGSEVAQPAASVESGWQPIATAPKDGAEIIIADIDDGHVYDVVNGYFEVLTEDEEDGPWSLDGGKPCCSYVGRAEGTYFCSWLADKELDRRWLVRENFPYTHWMPRPPAPQSSGESHE